MSGLYIHRNSISTDFIARPGAAGSLSQYFALVSAIFDMDLRAAGPGPSHVVFRAANLVLFLVAVVGAVPAIRREKDGRRKFVLLYLAMLAVVPSLAFLAKDKEPSGSIARYLTPLYYASAVFLALLVSGRYGMGRKARAALAGMLVLTALNNIQGGLEFRDAVTRHGEFAEFLERNRLEYGYADYSDANIITFLSGERVRVRPFIYSPLHDSGGRPSGRPLILPRYWVSKNDWYYSSIYDGATFLMLSRNLPEFEEMCRMAVRQFGDPARRLEFEDKQVFVWPHNIMKSICRVKFSRRTGHTTGSLEETPEGTIMHSVKGERGALVYGDSIQGPETDSLPSVLKMRAVFDLQVEGEPGKDAAIIGVSVWDSKQPGRLLGSYRRTVQTEAGAGPKKYVIEFEAGSKDRMLEHFVHSSGEADVKVLWITYEALNAGDYILAMQEE
jgi:hypothetical protein